MGLTTADEAAKRRVVTLTFDGQINRFPVVGFLTAIAESLQVTSDDFQVCVCVCSCVRASASMIIKTPPV